MVDFKWKFRAILIFIPRVQLSEEENTHIFEECLHARFRDLVYVQIRHSFGEVVDVVMIEEGNF